MSSPSCISLALLLATLFLSGCGNSGEFSVAPVRGQITCNGQPVAGGSVTFSPVGAGAGGDLTGKAASGPVDANGNFELSTYGERDGAVIGKHRVSYSPEDPYKAFPCAGAGVQEVEVIDGENNLTIELSQAAAK